MPHVHTSAAPSAAPEASEAPLFDALSAAIDDDGTITIRGHIDDNGGFYPTTVARLDPWQVAMFATTLANLHRHTS